MRINLTLSKLIMCNDAGKNDLLYRKWLKFWQQSYFKLIRQLNEPPKKKRNKNPGTRVHTVSVLFLGYHIRFRGLSLI